MKEKLAASLILLRVDLLLGLSMVFVSGGGGGLVTAESSVLPGCSGGSDMLSVAATTDSLLSVR